MLDQFIIKISLKYQHQLGLPDGSYNVSEIQDYIEYIIK